MTVTVKDRTEQVIYEKVIKVILLNDNFHQSLPKLFLVTCISSGYLFKISYIFCVRDEMIYTPNKIDKLFYQIDQFIIRVKLHFWNKITNRHTRSIKDIYIFIVFFEETVEWNVKKNMQTCHVRRYPKLLSIC